MAVTVPELLMRIYTPEEDLISIGASYLRRVGISYLFIGITQCYYLIMKLEGKASKSVVISVVTLVADVILDIFLIYGLMGLPKLGTNGSAYTTVIVELIALIWVIAESYRGNSLRPDRQGFLWFSPAVTKDLLKISAPLLAGTLAWGLRMSMHALIMGHMGSDATAASSITSLVQELVTCVGKGVGAGSGIMVGKLLGQDLFDKAKAYGRQFWIISLWIGLLHMMTLYILGPIVAEYFILTQTAKEYLLFMLAFAGLYVFADSLNTIFTCGVFPAGGDARYDAISVLIATWCLSIPLALLGTFVFHWPVIPVYILMCADEIVKLPWLYLRYKQYLWLTNLTREEN